MRFAVYPFETWKLLGIYKAKNKEDAIKKCKKFTSVKKKAFLLPEVGDSHFLTEVDKYRTGVTSKVVELRSMSFVVEVNSELIYGIPFWRYNPKT